MAEAYAPDRDPAAAVSLWSDQFQREMYTELRKLALEKLRKNRRDAAWTGPTSLLSNAYLVLLRDERLRQCRDRGYYVRAVARAMHRILIDQHRSRQAAKRGQGWTQLPLDVALQLLDSQAIDARDLHDSIERLATRSDRAAQVVEMRFFFAMTVPEIAEALEVSRSTVESDLRFARAWLQRDLGDTALTA